MSLLLCSFKKKKKKSTAPNLGEVLFPWLSFSLVPRYEHTQLSFQWDPHKKVLLHLPSGSPRASFGAVSLSHCLWGSPHLAPSCPGAAYSSALPGQVGYPCFNNQPVQPDGTKMCPFPHPPWPCTPPGTGLGPVPLAPSQWWSCVHGDGTQGLVLVLYRWAQCRELRICHRWVRKHKQCSRGKQEGEGSVLCTPFSPSLEVTCWSQQPAEDLLSLVSPAFVPIQPWRVVEGMLRGVVNNQRKMAQAFGSPFILLITLSLTSYIFLTYHFLCSCPLQCYSQF